MLVSSRSKILFLLSLWISAGSSLTLPINHTHLTVPSSSITCFPPLHGRPVTTVSGCRPTLNFIRTLPDYRRKQDFIEGRKPRLFSAGERHCPPFAWHLWDGDCAIRLGSENPAIVDKFSFADVRELATEIIQHCGDMGSGVGGYAPVGREVGWMVAVIGFQRRNSTVESDSDLRYLSLENESDYTSPVIGGLK